MNSLKLNTLGGSDDDVGCRVTADCIVPKNWQEFQRNDKTEVFTNFAKVASKNKDSGKVCVATVGDTFVSSWGPPDVFYLSPRTRKEASTRVLWHLNEAAKNELTDAMLHTVNTDVGVICHLRESVVPAISLGCTRCLDLVQIYCYS